MSISHMHDWPLPVTPPPPHPVRLGQLVFLLWVFWGGWAPTSLGTAPTSAYPLTPCIIHCSAFLNRKHTNHWICECVTHFLIDDSMNGSLYYTWHGISSLCWKNIAVLHVFLPQVRQWWIRPLSVTYKWVLQYRLFHLYLKFSQLQAYLSVCLFP